MELERGNRDFERRMEEASGEICERLEEAERCFKKAEEVRRLDWEKFEGQMRTAAEKHQFELDGIRRVSAQMTDEYVKVIRAGGEDMRRGSPKSRRRSMKIAPRPALTPAPRPKRS